MSVEGGTNNVRVGGQALIGGWGDPLMGMVPQSKSTHPPDIGQPWSNSLLDSQSFGQVGGGHRSFRKLPLITGEEGGGHNWKIFLFTFYMFLSI